VWIAIKPLLTKLAADPSRFDNVAVRGVDEHIWALLPAGGPSISKLAGQKRGC